MEDLIRRIKEYCAKRNGDGGNLHGLLYDLDTSNIMTEGCMEYAESQGDHVGSYLAETLLGVPEDVRLEAILRSGVSYMNETMANEYLAKLEEKKKANSVSKK